MRMAISIAIITVLTISYITRWISYAALILYMQRKKYTPPSDEEMEECTKIVVRKLLKSR